MISYGNPNIFFANIGRGDVGIAPYNNSINSDDENAAQATNGRPYSIV